jgi:hypothetical protein
MLTPAPGRCPATFPTDREHVEAVESQNLSQRVDELTAEGWIASFEPAHIETKAVGVVARGPSLNGGADYRRQFIGRFGKQRSACSEARPERLPVRSTYVKAAVRELLRLIVGYEVGD